MASSPKTPLASSFELVANSASSSASVKDPERVWYVVSIVKVPAGIDRSSSTPLLFGARTADCAPSNPAPITWRMDNLVVTVVKDLDDDGICDDSQASVCSNGVLEPGEICDDGDRIPGDGCSESCALENAWRGGGGCAVRVENENDGWGWLLCSLVAGLVRRRGRDHLADTRT